MAIPKAKIATAFILPLSILVATCNPSAAEPTADVPKVLAKYRAALPDAKDLAVYQLDWAPTLKAAKARAAKEQRPILLMVVHNSYGNLYTGHC